MEDHRLVEMVLGMIGKINSQPRDIVVNLFLFRPEEALNQKSSRDLILKLKKKILYHSLEEPPHKGIFKLMEGTLKKDIRAHLHIPDISRAWNVPLHQLELNCSRLESKNFSTGKAYYWESLIDCYGDSPGMSDC